MAAVRRIVPGTRVGHAGALDPAASGVIVVCLGAYTRLAFLFQEAEKEYEGVVLFGRATDTLDLEGRTVRRAAVPLNILDRVTASLVRFRGGYEQEVPRFSAAKWAGRPLYRWARAGADTPAKTKRVDLRAVDVWAIPKSRRRIGFRIVTGPGFYVRSWARDVGDAADVPAVLAVLHRTRVGPYGADHAVSLDRLCPSTVASTAVAGARAFPWVPVMSVDGETFARLCHGLAQRSPHDPGDGVVAVAGPGGTFGLVAQARGGMLHPRVVLHGEGIQP